MHFTRHTVVEHCHSQCVSSGVAGNAQVRGMLHTVVNAAHELESIAERIHIVRTNLVTARIPTSDIGEISRNTAAWISSIREFVPRRSSLRTETPSRTA